MKKEYETPKAELMDFDYADIVVASGSNSARTDEANTQWNTCDWRYVDVKSTDGSVCGAVPHDIYNKQ